LAGYYFCIAKNNLDIFKKYSGEKASLFAKTLKGAVIYSLTDGIFLFNQYSKQGNKIIFSNIYKHLVKINVL